MHKLSYGEARSLAHRTPSEEAFDELCTYIGNTFDHDPLVMDYLERLLTGWDTERYMPDGWVQALLEGIQVPQARLCTHIEYFEGVTVTGAISLVSSQCLKNLRSLDLGIGLLDDSFASAIASATHFKSLEVLELDHNRITLLGFLEIMSSPELSSLKAVQLMRNNIKFDPNRNNKLANSTVHLTSLSLQLNIVGDTGATYLAQQESLSGLHTLNLKDTQLGPVGVRAIAQSENMAGLRTLILTGNYIKSAVADVLNSDHIQLEQLHLSSTGIGDDEVEIIARSENARSLRRLNIKHNNFGPGAAQALASSPYLGNLLVLELTADIGIEGKRALADSPYLSDQVRASFANQLE